MITYQYLSQIRQAAHGLVRGNVLTFPFLHHFDRLWEVAQQHVVQSEHDNLYNKNGIDL